MLRFIGSPLCRRSRCGYSIKITESLFHFQSILQNRFWIFPHMLKNESKHLNRYYTCVHIYHIPSSGYQYVFWRLHILYVDMGPPINRVMSLFINILQTLILQSNSSGSFNGFFTFLNTIIL